VQEFRVINTDYSANSAAPTAGIVNIHYAQRPNDLARRAVRVIPHDKMDAVNLLQASGAHALRQISSGRQSAARCRKQDLHLWELEVQRRGESPFYNSAVLRISRHQ